MGDTIVKLYQKQNFVIGEDILKTIKKNNLTLDEALLIIYFCGNNNHPILDIDEIMEKFGMEELSIMQAFSSITNKNLIKIKMTKNKEGKVEELIDLTPFYETIALDINEKKQKTDSEDIFYAFEQEFARPLSSMEYELINDWLNKGYKPELISSALKEAIYNGSFTLRYIDAILREWHKKGFTSKKDVDVYLKRRKNTPKTHKEEELFDYNWLDGDE